MEPVYYKTNPTCSNGTNIEISKQPPLAVLSEQTKAYHLGDLQVPRGNKEQNRTLGPQSACH